MTIGSALLICLGLCVAVPAVLLFAFALIVYIAEYRRETKALKDLAEIKKQQVAAYSNPNNLPLVYLSDLIPASTSTTTQTTKKTKPGSIIEEEVAPEPKTATKKTAN